MLDDVDWSAVQHAYGPATDTPQALRQLTADDPKQRSAGYDRLFSTICQDGAIYSATAQAVPYLLSLLREKDLPDRDKLLDLLIAIREGGSWYAVNRHLVADDDISDEYYDEILQEELYWVEETYKAVDKGLGAFIKQLGNDDPRVRARAARLLALYHHRRDLVLPAMQSHYAFEQDEVVKASTLMAIVRLIADKFDEAEGALNRVWEIEGAPLVRLVAAQLLVVYQRGAVQPDVAKTLLNAFANPGELAEAYRDFPWAQDDLRYDLISTLHILGEPYTNHVIREMVRYIAKDRMALTEPEQILPPLMQMTFGDDKAPTPDTLTPAQAAVLKALIASPFNWEGDPEVELVLFDYNLPETRDGLKAFIE